ncbi:hypothetical protein AB0M25_16825 [Streptomyces griseomycini]|nr:hypothetical protein [Streptomyces griseomycini]
MLPFLVPAVVAPAAWAARLGRDQHRDVHPDGSATGPYEACQVIGLVLTLPAPVRGAASRHHTAGAVPGTTAGLTAASHDRSDDAGGLSAVGAGTVTAGSLAVTAAVSAVITPAARPGRPTGARRPTAPPSSAPRGAR